MLWLRSSCFGRVIGGGALFAAARKVASELPGSRHARPHLLPGPLAAVVILWTDLPFRLYLFRRGTAERSVFREGAAAVGIREMRIFRVSFVERIVAVPDAVAVIVQIVVAGVPGVLLTVLIPEVEALEALHREGL